MKKLALTALFGLVSTAAFAAPVGQTFTGFGVGVDLTSTKYEKAKRATGVGLVVDYGIDYGNNWVGVIEGKIKFNSSKLVDYTFDNNTRFASTKVTEKWRGNLSYLQGYRVLPDLLPYVKVGYVISKMDGKSAERSPGRAVEISKSETGSGLGLGLGMKYAVSSNVELGVEYLRTRIKLEDERVNGNLLGASLTYRF